MEHFSFDEWADLYRTNPGEFEKKRKEVIDAEINKAPISSRNSLRVLQMECDAIHNSFDPMDATVQISQLMIDKSLDMQNLFLDLSIKLQDMGNINY